MGFTPGTPQFDAAVAYYEGLRYANPRLLAKNGLSYYTNSPAVQWFLATDAQYGYRASVPTLGRYRGNYSGQIFNYVDWQDADGNNYGGVIVPSLGISEGLTTLEEPGSKLSPLHDPNFDPASAVALREGESVLWNPDDSVWNLRGPAEQDTTRGLTWSDVRAGIEFVAIAIGPALVGGALFAPEAGAAGEVAAPTAAEAIAAPEAADVFAFTGAETPAVDVGVFTGGDVVVPGSAGGTGAATIPADAAVVSAPAIEAPASFQPIAQADVPDIFGFTGAEPPAVDAGVFTAGDPVVPGSAAGAGAATIPADVGIPAAAIPPAALPAIPAALSNALQSIASSTLVTAVMSVIAPPKPAPAPVAVAPAAPAEPSLVPLLVLGGIAVKVLFFS